MGDSRDIRLRLSLVIPCYNEEGNLGQLFKKAEELVSREPNSECIFVNNGSTDNSRISLNNLAASNSRIQVVHVPVNMGYGHGIKKGLEVARGELVGWTHADLQTDPLDALRALNHIGTDSRPVFIKGRRTSRPAADRFFTAGMSLFESLLFGMLLRDINAQPTLFSRPLLSEIQKGPDDFSLDLFALVASRKNDYRQIRITVRYGPRYSGSSKWNTSMTERLKFIKRTVKFSLDLSGDQKKTK